MAIERGEAKHGMDDERELVVFAGRNDWANLCHGWMRAINRYSRRYRARCIVERAHPLGYAQDITLETDGEQRESEARALFGAARVLIHSGDGDYGAWEALRAFGIDTEGPALGTVHAGSAYRAAPLRYNALDRELDFALRVVSPDLVRFCAEDPRVQPALGVAPMGTPTDEGRVVIAHSPSHRTTKGTPLIDAVVRALPEVRSGEVEWRLIEGVSHEECMRQKAGVSIFIDQVMPTIGGFGVSALEAMGLGAVCLASQNHLSPALERFWPRPPIIDVQSAEALRDALTALLQDPERLRAQREASRRWARTHASAVPCAARWDAWLDEAIETQARPKRRHVFFEATAEPAITCGVIARAQRAIELASLTAALRSVRDVADECVVVLDERSSGEVDAALRALGVRVERRRWTDDFAEARNAVHPLCDSDWVLVIDSDELLVDQGNLRQAWAHACETDADAVTIDVHAFDDAGRDQVLRQPRLYRKSRARWRFPVHNELVGLETAVASAARIDAIYAGAIEDKLARSLPHLLAMADAEPDEPRWSHFLSRAYCGAKDIDAAIHWGERCVSQAPRHPGFVQTWVDLVLTKLARGDQGDGSALATVLTALHHHPNHPDLWHCLATLGLARWYQLAPTAHQYTTTRSTEFAPNLATVAPQLGVPLTFGVPASQDERRAHGRTRDTSGGQERAVVHRHPGDEPGLAGPGAADRRHPGA